MVARRRWIVLFCFFALLGFAIFAQQRNSGGQYPNSLLSGLQWRDVGPMRAGRTFGVAGHASQPDTFYFGSVGGGVWKTENAGRTWYPISDAGIPIGSIGAIAVAPSNARVVYVGTGEPDIRSQHSYGNGMYKSTDAGKTWTHIGLEGTRQIGRVVVDPANANRVYVAALGHVYDANPERGVYRSTDGGATWKKILSNAKDPNNVGAIDLAIDPKNPRVLYASLWATRRPPWSVYAPTNLPGGGLYKSTDGGDTWKQLTGGLPTDPFVGKIGIAVAPSNPNRLWAVVDDTGAAVAAALGGGGGGRGRGAAEPGTGGGIYVSDDAGATWKLVNSETRLWGRGWYFEAVTVDPANPDRAYVMNTGTFMTTDGGKTFAPVKAAPGGDDYHQMWINPKDGNRLVLSSDQGTVVSVDGGNSWSTWYNQPTAQIYHVAADNRFPYWLYGAQQDSGGVGVATWSRQGVLSFRDWEPTCEAGESNTVVPDPKDGNILYGSGAGRCDQRFNVAAPLGGQLPAPDPDNPNRKTWTLPQVFSQADEALYYANQFVMRTRDRGRSWEKISPDLTRLHPAVPETLDPVTAKDIDEPMTDRFGVVYSIGPSPLAANTVWVGTDDGLIHVTRDDGKTWNNVTPPDMTSWSKVSQIEAGHFDVATAYASVDRHRVADNKPYIYRTHDGGKTWQNTVAGIPEGAYVNSVKEDPQAKGLLYAATELRVYVSFNDGAQWQPLQNNMPVTSVRDIVVHGDDLAIATYGRGFWVMDQMPALRQIAEQGVADRFCECVPVQTRRRLRHPRRRDERHAAAARGAAIAESAGRSGGLLLAEDAREAAAETGIAGPLRRGASLRRQRYAGARTGYRNAERAGRLAAAVATAVIRCRHASFRPGRRRGSAAGLDAAPRRRRHLMPARPPVRRLPPHSRWSRRPRRPGWRRWRWTRWSAHAPARPLHRAPHRGRPDLYPAGHREAGSPRRP